MRDKLHEVAIQLQEAYWNFTGYREWQGKEQYGTIARRWPAHSHNTKGSAKTGANRKINPRAFACMRAVDRPPCFLGGLLRRTASFPPFRSTLTRIGHISVMGCS